jgi:AcrR family transcriptional regulator
MSPAPARTSHDRIVDAGLELLESGGLDAVTMAAIAERVGVKPASLYKHVRDRSALIAELVEATALALGRDLTAGDTLAATPRERLATLAHGYRAFAAAHPRATTLLFMDLGPGVALDAEASRAAAWPVLEVATELVGAERALPVARVLTAFVHGFTSMESAGAFRLGGDVDAAFEAGVAILADGLAA